ncbi:hypothetical protein AS203_03945 [Hoylesella enoeca]|uniref:Uncharacterized protein n=1 Tax=Hoylesella enoeca TaxID=76123 RepID=A0A0S2KK30_9BACT|nr:hypothetical protein [Hoylesella enoeca]ALO48338.1 hypothetical protein AS203_03945 [Hoylesella enoeca]
MVTKQQLLLQTQTLTLLLLIQWQVILWLLIQLLLTLLLLCNQLELKNERLTDGLSSSVFLFIPYLVIICQTPATNKPSIE